MTSEIYKRPYKIRKAAATGLEVTIPSGTPFKPGDVVIAFYDSFILYVTKGTQVNEALLRQAISVRTDDMQVEKLVAKPIIRDASETKSA